LGVIHALPRKPLHHSPRDQRVILGPAQPLCDKFETPQKSGKIRKRPHIVHLLPRERRIQHHDRFAINRPFQMKVQLRETHKIEVPMTAAEMEAIIGGYHGDPFRVLGPHPINTETERPGWVIRAFLPQARTASALLPDGTAVPMKKSHREGMYAA